MSDLDLIKKIEKMLNVKFLPSEKIDWDSWFLYKTNDEGLVIGLGLNGCGNKAVLRILSILKDLNHLQTLDLSGNNITDISFLKNLNHLQTLYLSYNNITDYSFLKDLNQLQALDLRGNNITDISFLKDLNQLQALDLRGNNITDYWFLKDLNHLQTLYLRGNNITDYSFLEDLNHLQALDLGGNNITDISFLKDLNQLQTLDLRGNNITDYWFLKDLNHLQTLYLSVNNITDISFLEDLNHLQTLDLRGNNITDISFLKDLNHLQALDLGGNNITDISFLKDLNQLQTLDLGGNNITDITVLENFARLKRVDFSKNKIEKLPSWIVGLVLRIIHTEHYYHNGVINFYNNPIKHPPVEIVKEGTDAVRDYFASLEGKETVKLNEVKVLLVGEGMAGKTSLLKQLQGKTFDKDESQTHGINVVSLRADKIKGLDKHRVLQDFWLNCWDFGGQEVMHASHRFFMSKRSLYLLMLDSRTDSKKYHWLKHIEKYGGDSPLIVVMNKIDANPNYNIEQNKINAAFSQIKNRFHRISCKTSEGLVELIDCMGKAIPETEFFDTYISKDWMKIKQQLISETQEEQYIDRDRFIQICEQHHVSKASEQNTLLKYLNDLGIVLYFEKLDLADIYVLDPHWVTIGVYKIINSAKIEKGILDEKDLDYILNKEKIKTADEYDPAKENTITYRPQEQRYIVNIMMQFELCYEYDKGNGQYIVPDQLPKELENEPQLSGETRLEFIMAYDYLPGSILSRLMLQLKNDIPAGQQWKFGMLLDNADLECRAKVKSDEDKKTIAITVQGEERRKRDYFSIIRHHILDISREFENLKIDERIPLPGYQDRYVGYKELLGYEKAGKDDYFDGVLGQVFSVSDMLDSVISKTDRKMELDLFNIWPKDSKPSIGEVNVTRDTYNISGQTGAVGPGAHAQDINFNQIWTEMENSFDLERVSEALSLLRSEAQKVAKAPEEFVAIGEIASAEIAAKEGSGPKMLEHLKKAGKWTLDVATDIGTDIASEVIKKSMGL